MERKDQRDLMDSRERSEMMVDLESVVLKELAESKGLLEM